MTICTADWGDMPVVEIARGIWVKPSTGAHPDHAGHQIGIEYGARQTAAAAVEKLHDVACPDPALRGVAGMHMHRFASGDLTRAAGGCRVQLTVQPAGRLIRQEMKGKGRGERCPEIFSRSAPDWMSGAIGQVHGGDCV